MLDNYERHVVQRASEGLPPLPLNAEEVSALIKALRGAQGLQADLALHRLSHNVPPGADDAARIKAIYLRDIVYGNDSCACIDAPHAVRMLGTMLGGYNVTVLVELLSHDTLGALSAAELANTLLVYDAFNDVAERARAGSQHARTVLESWANATWLTHVPPVANEVTLTVFKVSGEINTDQLSPAQHAWSRADVALHARSLLEQLDDFEGKPLDVIEDLRSAGHPIAFVGDVVGTGSSRKSAVNSLIWAIGNDVPYVPNKRTGGYVLAGKIAPIFFNTLQDAGALAIECDVQALSTGDVVVVRPYEGVLGSDNGDVLSRFSLRTPELLDEVRAGGRISLIIGRTLTAKARAELNLEPQGVLKQRPQSAGTVKSKPTAYTLGQKMLGKACGLPGVSPGDYCEPRVATVGSQDTTGPMNRTELKELACLGFNAELVLQTFCHTAAYPKPTDIETQRTLPDFMTNRGGVSLRPGDGIIHSWLNRLLLPDQVGTGSDSHTRFPLGISFPGGSGVVAFAATLGVMPLDVPESVLVRFCGDLRPGITLRDAVNAIPYFARQRGLLTLSKRNKVNAFSGRILEIEGLEHLTPEQAFEFSDASAERSASACTFNLGVASVTQYLRSNIKMIEWMIEAGYRDARALERRAEAMQAWLAEPKLLRADQSAKYAEVLEINCADIDEPLLACPNDPDDVKPLSLVHGDRVDEVFIGSCMTNIAHFRAAARLLEHAGAPLATRLWIAPPTKMDEATLRNEGCYNVFANAGARTELPGCSLCMGNQARVGANTTVVSTSTRNFPNRLGQGARVYLASAELAAVAAIEGKLPTLERYMNYARSLDGAAAEIYRYLDFEAVPVPISTNRREVSLTA